MRKVLWPLGWALPGLSALVLVGACDSTSTPVSPSSATGAAATAATAATAVASSASVLIRGTVVDAANRPVGDAYVECPTEVTCVRPGQVNAGGHEHRATTTRADGSYEVVAAGMPADGSGVFRMNANRLGYQVEWREVKWPDPACTWDRTGCALTVDFSLSPIVDQ